MSWTSYDYQNAKLADFNKMPPTEYGVAFGQYDIEVLYGVILVMTELLTQKR